MNIFLFIKYLSESVILRKPLYNFFSKTTFFFEINAFELIKIDAKWPSSAKDSKTKDGFLETFLS